MLERVRPFFIFNIADFFGARALIKPFEDVTVSVRLHLAPFAHLLSPFPKTNCVTKISTPLRVTYHIVCVTCQVSGVKYLVSSVLFNLVLTQKIKN